MIRGGREIAVAFFVVVSAPICVTWARDALTTETPVTHAVTPPAAVMLAQIGEPEALHRRYGLAVIAMPDRPAITNPNADAHAATSDVRVPTCPEVRAIVSGDDAFAIIAWDDVSYVAKLGQTLSAPVGDVTLQNLRQRSLTLTQGGSTLQCSLKR